MEILLEQCFTIYPDNCILIPWHGSRLQARDVTPWWADWHDSCDYALKLLQQQTTEMWHNWQLTVMADWHLVTRSFHYYIAIIPEPYCCCRCHANIHPTWRFNTQIDGNGIYWQVTHSMWPADVKLPSVGARHFATIWAILCYYQSTYFWWKGFSILYAGCLINASIMGTHTYV